MKKFLLLSHYAPKPGFNYPEHDCPLAHREGAHRRIYALDRYWPEGVLWQTLEVEKVSIESLLEAVSDTTWDGIWLSGSPYLLNEIEAHPWIKNALEATKILLNQNQTPVIGLCFGLQLLAAASGGQVKPTDKYIIGETDILDINNEKIVKTKAYHENYVSDLPSRAEIIGFTTQGFPYLVEFSQKVVGIQSHPECALKEANEMQNAENYWKNYFTNLIQ